MADRVKKNFRDKRQNNKLFQKGDLHESKDSKRRSFLIEKGYLEKEEVESTELNHVGGGYYELPNGERVKGKEKAIAALKDEETAGE